MSTTRKLRATSARASGYSLYTEDDSDKEIVRNPKRRRKSYESNVSVDDLPNEVLTQIFRYLCEHCSGRIPIVLPGHRARCSSYLQGRAALYAMCLVSRTVRPVAQDILFHEFQPGKWEKLAGREVTWERRLLPFARAVIERPDLADAVRVVVMPRKIFEESVSIAAGEELSRKAAAARGIDFCPAWRRRLRDDAEWPPEFGALLASFLDDLGPRSRLPRLVRRNVMRDWMVGEVMTAALACMPRLEYLDLQTEETSLFHPPAMRALGLDGLALRSLELINWNPALIGCAPNLVKLKINYAEQFYDVPDMPNLKELHLNRMTVTSLQLERILGACTGKLESFTYEGLGEMGMMPWVRTRMPTWTNYESTGSVHEIKYEDRLDVGANEFMLEDLLRFLRPHGESLTWLYLDYRRPRGQAERGSWPSLKELTALKTLVIYVSANDFIVQPARPALVHFLPASIEALSLSSNYHDLDRRLESGLRDLASAMAKNPALLPRLKRVRCNGSAALANIGDHLAAVGVEFRYLAKSQAPRYNGVLREMNMHDLFEFVEIVDTSLATLTVCPQGPFEDDEDNTDDLVRSRSGGWL